MKITFLGTGSMMPTKERSAFSILVSHENENILVDCGEGTQRQLRFIEFSPAKITKILITHWHGDHVLGLPGLIQTLAASNYQKTLEIYGPKGTKNFIKKIMGLFVMVMEEKLKIKIIEITKNGIFYENNLIKLESIRLQHTTSCLAYSITEANKRKINLDYLKKFGLVKHPLLGNLQKGSPIIYKGKKITPEKATFIKMGKKISIITDTKLCKECFNIAKNSDILICESTFMANLKNKAAEYMHLTTEQAALIAKKSNCKKLILTHISQRYKESNSKEMENQAKKIFKDSCVARDLLIINTN
ncbi:ribonuclease Z [Candidatus Woesearchaeota archaeon]|nr:ribonuclease Z [Candidatus Woesearchaeota archaeon]